MTHRMSVLPTAVSGQVPTSLPSHGADVQSKVNACFATPFSSQQDVEARLDMFIRLDKPFTSSLPKEMQTEQTLGW